MRTEDEINKIKLANTIINRGTRKLGVRPLNVGAFENPYKQKSPRPRVDFNTRRNINELAAKLKREQAINERLKKPATFQTALYSILAIVVVFFLIFVFNPVDIIAGFNDRAKPPAQPLVAKNNPAGRNLVICSGAFSDQKAAEKYKKELSERLGVPLKIIKDGVTYTVQVGPSYKTNEDALIVFDELSRYSVSELSLRYAG